MNKICRECESDDVEIERGESGEELYLCNACGHEWTSNDEWDEEQDYEQRYKAMMLLISVETGG